MTREEIFAEMFGELTVSDKIACFNKFASYYGTEPIQNMDEYEFNELCNGLTPWEIVEKFGDIDTSADYFVYGVYFETYDESSIEDYIEDYVEQIYNTKRFGEWVDEIELDERCTDYFTGVIEREFGEQDEDVLYEFFNDGHYDSDADDEENISEFKTFLEERNKNEE